MTAPSRALTVYEQQQKSPAKRRKAAPVLCRVTVYSPSKLAALRTAQQLGVPLAVSFDGYSLTVSAAKEIREP